MPKCDCVKSIDNACIANLHASDSMGQNFTTSKEIFIINKPFF